MSSQPPAADPTLARPRRARRIAFSVVSALLLLLLLEGGLRLAGFVHVPGEDVPNEARRHELTDERLYEPDADLLWRLLPSRTLDVADPAYPRFRTNSLGLRGPQVGPRLDPAELRVVCLGDSITFGVGLGEGATWPDRLRAELESELPEGWTGVQVVNAGVAGYSAVQGERLLTRIASLDPDIVVFWFGMNDAKPAFGVPDTALRVDPAERRGGGFSRWTPHLRILQLAAWLAQPADSGATRVSQEEFGGIVSRLASSSRPRLLWVHTPEQMSRTLAQLEGLLARAREAGAVRVAAHGAVLIPYAPAPGGLLTPELVATVDGVKTLRVGPPRAQAYEIDVAELSRRVESLRAWKARLDDLLALLPEGALTAQDVFGSLPPEQAFSDNCHLTPAGAAQAAAAVAEAIRRAPPPSAPTPPRDR